jgi:hypothetical protein
MLEMTTGQPAATYRYAAIARWHFPRCLQTVGRVDGCPSRTRNASVLAARVDQAENRRALRIGGL